MGDTIHVKRGILHILDRDSGSAVCSDVLLRIDQLEEYLEKRVERALADDESRELVLSDHDSKALDEIKAFGLENLAEESQRFIPMSQELAKLFYNLIGNYDIPSADLLFVDFRQESDVCLAVLKMNYRKGYIHHVGGAERIQNSIVCQSATLPGESQKVDEFLLFNFTQGTLLLKEKKYEIDGSKEKYISRHILHVPDDPTPKEKLTAVKAAAKKVADTYFPDDPQAGFETEDAIYRCYQEDQTLDLNRMGDQICRGINSVKEAFFSEVRGQGLDGDQIPLSGKLEKMVEKKHRIVTEDGVEVKLPVGFFHRKDKFEIISNGDGTISVLIKNVEII